MWPTVCRKCDLSSSVRNDLVLRIQPTNVHVIRVGEMALSCASGKICPVQSEIAVRPVCVDAVNISVYQGGEWDKAGVRIQECFMNDRRVDGRFQLRSNSLNDGATSAVAS